MLRNPQVGTEENPGKIYEHAFIQAKDPNRGGGRIQSGDSM